MNEKRKLEILNALQAYTEENTESSVTAKEALVREGIYLENGELVPEYKEKK